MACAHVMATHAQSHRIVAPLLPSEHVDDVHAALLRVRREVAGDEASTATDVELLALVEAASAALASVDQETGLSAAARSHDGAPDGLQGLIAVRRTAVGEPTADETLTPTMLVPLLRRAAKLACTGAEEEQHLLTAVGALVSSLAGHGEHTYRIGLGGGRPPLLLHHAGALSPISRLGVGACTAGWAGLQVAGRAVLELGCGAGAVGLACAALGAREVWCVDTDAGSLALATRNAAANGATAVRVGRLDATGEAEAAARPEGMPRRFGLVVTSVVDGADDALRAAARVGAALRAAAQQLDMADGRARVLCCSQLPAQRRSGREADGSIEEEMAEAEGAVRTGEALLDCGLRLVTSETLVAAAQSDERLQMLLLAPAAPPEGANTAGDGDGVCGVPAVPHEVDASAAVDASVIGALKPTAMVLVSAAACDMGALVTALEQKKIG